MNFLLLLPPALSFLLLAAQLVRIGRYGAAAAMLILIGCLATRRRFVVRTTQVVLVLGSVFWLHTLYLTRGALMFRGFPVERLTVVLLGIAAFTLASPLVFLSRRLQERFGRGEDSPKP